jgi:predicted 3-demethylubiquinone-9 3-methyltransferase (glyoxalase superfamily)
MSGLFYLHAVLRFDCMQDYLFSILSVNLCNFLKNKNMTTQTISPFLWFDGNAEEAVDFYTNIFKNSSKGAVALYGEEGPGVEGSVMTIEFWLDGQQFIALNGGPIYKFTEAVSFAIHCKDQQEVDYYWEKLTDGGSDIACGWLKDKFGLSWQVIPEVMLDMIKSQDKAKKSRVMKAMMTMVKLDVEKLKEAFDG